MHPLNSAGLVCMSAQNGGKERDLIRKKQFLFKMCALYPRCPILMFWGKKSFDFCTHLTVSATCSTGSPEAKRPLPCALQTELWKAVDGRFVGRAFRVTGQKGVEEQIPPLATSHPRNAGEILQCALNLVPVCTESGMAKIALLGESKSKVEVCVCCCCTRNET